MSERLPSIPNVDAVPERISVRELYHYKILLRTEPDITLLEGPDEPKRPRGEVRIELPYDGHRAFPIEIAESLKGRISPHGSTAGKIGWFALGNSLDWEGDWDPQPGVDLIPIRIPLIQPPLVDVESWTTDDLRVVIDHQYVPESPRYSPVQFEMRVYDSVQDSPDSFKDTKLEEYESNDVQEILKELSGKPLQGGRLVIDFEITIFIPSLLTRKKNEDVQVYIDEIGLNWPSIAPDWQLYIEDITTGEKREVGWRYDPDNKVVEIRGIQAEAQSEEEGSPLKPYKFKIRLTLFSPGTLIGEDLEGWVRLRLDGCLLSSRQVAWVDARGMRIPNQQDADLRKREKLISKETHLIVNFTALLSEQFHQRRSVVYRQWYFPGVKLSYARLDDIAAALRDIGYQIEGDPKFITTGGGDNSDKSIIGVVESKRIHLERDFPPAILTINLWGIPISPAATRRERELSEGGTVSTEMATSDLILQVRGHMNGPGSLLALDIERLMTELKNRFTAVADTR